MKEVESYNNQLHIILVGKGEANELVKTFPVEIEKLESKTESASKIIVWS